MCRIGRCCLGLVCLWLQPAHVLLLAAENLNSINVLMCCTDMYAAMVSCNCLSFIDHNGNSEKHAPHMLLGSFNADVSGCHSSGTLRLSCGNVVMHFKLAARLQSLSKSPM